MSERLTKFDYDNYKALKPKQHIVDKLAQFEDFMEEQDFKSIDELKEFIKSQETNIKFYTRVSEENLTKYQALKSRWEKLKEYVTYYVECYTCGSDILDIMQKDILKQMQQLEKESEDEE